MARSHGDVPNFAKGRKIGRKSNFEYTLGEFKNKLWRLNNLYWITNKDGKRVKFKMSKEQLAFFMGMHTRNIILKARQLGFTTEMCIILLDAALFEGKKCAMIAHTLPDANRLFSEKVKYAYDNLPDLVKAANPASNDAKGQLVFRKGGSVYVSNSFRGGTLAILHISEFGKICARWPDKAREIVTGALQAVSKEACATIESTAEGRHGYFYDYCETARKLMETGSYLTAMDWKFFFFPWYSSNDYCSSEEDTKHTKVPTRLTRYFEELEAKLNVTIGPGHRAWYAVQERTLGDDMKREYPSTAEEAFAQAVVGAYYSKQFAQLYKEGRFLPTERMPKNPNVEVDTYWDWGVSDSTSVWFVRKINDNEYHVVDHYSCSGEPLQHYMEVLKRKADENGWIYGRHVSPKDGEKREIGNFNKSLIDQAAEGHIIDGVRFSIRFEVLPGHNQKGGANLADGIDAVRNILPKCVFDQDKCGLFDSGDDKVGSQKGGLVNLESYRKEWDSKRGCWKSGPLHDASSHDADAFRYFAVANTQISRSVKERSVRD